MTVPLFSCLDRMPYAAVHGYRLGKVESVRFSSHASDTVSCTCGLACLAEGEQRGATTLCWHLAPGLCTGLFVRHVSMFGRLRWLGYVASPFHDDVPLSPPSVPFTRPLALSWPPGTAPHPPSTRATPAPSSAPSSPLPCAVGRNSWRPLWRWVTVLALFMFHKPTFAWLASPRVDYCILSVISDFVFLLLLLLLLLMCFAQGLSCVLPVDLLPIFTPQEAEALVCGQPTIDISLLKRVAECVLLRSTSHTPTAADRLCMTMCWMAFGRYQPCLHAVPISGCHQGLGLCVISWSLFLT